MKLSTLIFGIIALTSKHKNRCSYIRAENRPLNIAHRGLCSILPQNTIEAFEAALFQGADFVELDVVLTKDLDVLVMHDPFLSRITNIQDFPEFEMRKNVREYDGVLMNDWWTDQFTLQELKKLRIKQVRGQNRTDLFDFKFTFPTLDQVLARVIHFNRLHKGKRNPDGRLGGILIEAKDSEMYRKLFDGIQIGEKIVQILKKYKLNNLQKATELCPIYLQSFDFKTVQYWSVTSSLPRNFLIQGNPKIDLDEIARYADGIGFEDTLLWNYDKNQPLPLLQQTKKKDLLVHAWTFQDDNPFFGTQNPIQMYMIAHQRMKLDGIITEFSDVLVPISNLLKNNYLLKKTPFSTSKRATKENHNDKKQQKSRMLKIF